MTFDVVETFEKGVLDSVRRLGGPAAEILTDEDIFESYKRGRDLYPGRSSEIMGAVYLHVAKQLGLRANEMSAQPRWEGGPGRAECGRLPDTGQKPTFTTPVQFQHS